MLAESATVEVQGGKTEVGSSGPAEGCRFCHSDQSRSTLL